jgi:hypothetical protein
MKSKLVILLGLTLLAAPLSGSAAIDTTVNLPTGSYTTGTDSQFDIVLANYQSSSDISVLTIADSNVADIKSAMFLDKSGWVTLTPYQQGSDVLARFISDTGFTVNGNRVINLRINFKTPKNYVVGYSLTNSNGQTLSSAAVPVSVNGRAVLGEQFPTSVSTGYVFPRPLRTGLSGDDVTQLQNLLTTEGFYTGPITGYYGAQTRAAVKTYQIAHGIAGANGVVGPATLATLNQ